MELPIDLIKYHLIRLKKQLKRAESRKNSHLSKQAIKEKGIKNLKEYISEIEQAVIILEHTRAKALKPNAGFKMPY